MKSANLQTAMLTAMSALALLATACGDDSGGGSNSTGTPGGDVTLPGNGMPGGGMTGTTGGDTTGMPGGGMTGTTGGDTTGMPGGDGASGNGGTVEPLAPTFTNVFNQVIVNTCAGPLCHTGGLGNLVMADQAGAYAALVNVAAMGMNVRGEVNPTSCVDTGMMRVVPGNPDMSLLYAKVRTDVDVPCGNRMPTGGMLSPEHLELIRAWIANGAMND